MNYINDNTDFIRFLCFSLGILLGILFGMLISKAIRIWVKSTSRGATQVSGVGSHTSTEGLHSLAPVAIHAQELFRTKEDFEHFRQAYEWAVLRQSLEK